MASFATLDRAGQALALRAIGLSLLFRLALWALPFKKVRALADRRLARAPHRREGDRWPAAVRAAVERAARTIPWSTCLVRALVAEWLLRAGGHACRLSLGVARAGADSVAAHAWVESGAWFVTGDAPAGRYQPLVAYTSPER